jgi:hypothetical protein
MYVLKNLTTGNEWTYDSEAQLKTATRLFAVQNPSASLAVVINGKTFVVRA